MKIAISGKGGVGKSALTSLLCQAFRDSGKKVFAIDADPDSNLAVNLGFPPDLSITPLSEMHELIHERTGAAPGGPTVFFTLNPRVDDIPDRFAVEHDGIRLMIMGTVRRGGSGCACPEHVIVKEFLRHLLVERDEFVLLDTSAGIEHFSRGTAQYVDVLLVVVQATSASIQTFHRIKSMAADLKIGVVQAVANRIRTPADLERIRCETGVDPIGIVPESGDLMDYHGAAAQGAVRDAIVSLIERITSLNNTPNTTNNTTQK
jgi:CO dehydrogenase maturation factor